MSELITKQAVLNTLDNADKFLDEERTVEKYKELLTECIKVLPSADVRENIPVKFIPINADCRGYADIFRCTNCGGIITVSSVEKELDYDFCPWCGGKADEQT